jgi:hypothetical protein
MLTLELDENTELALKELATKQGKTSEQWLKELISQVLKPQHLNGYSESMTDENLLISDAFFESLENIEKPRSLLELIGKGKGCFKSTDEIDLFIREERDAWEK